MGRRKYLLRPIVATGDVLARPPPTAEAISRGFHDTYLA
jgi:hypothetical protein